MVTWKWQGYFYGKWMKRETYLSLSKTNVYGGIELKNICQRLIWDTKIVRDFLRTSYRDKNQFDDLLYLLH
jgi:hypothetical protein